MFLDRVLEFTSNQYENKQICYKHIEDVNVTFWRRTIIFLLNLLHLQLYVGLN